METYGLSARKKKRKLWLIPLIILAAFAVAMIALGIILNITNADRNTISAAVEENIQLKQQVSDLSAQISQLQNENDELRAQISAEGEPPSTDEPLPSVLPSAEHSRGRTPRN